MCVLLRLSLFSSRLKDERYRSTRAKRDVFLIRDVRVIYSLARANSVMHVHRF